MSKRKNILIYLGIVLVLLTLIIIFYEVNDMLTMILFATIIVVTSIYTYGNRRNRKWSFI